MTHAHRSDDFLRFMDQVARAAPPAPPPDEGVLRREYVDRGLDGEEDTFCLVRVVGNDLPPRHRVGQARENVRFTLQNEADLPGCTKHWIINRIVLPEEEDALVRLMDAFGASYEIIAFDPEAYRRIGWDFESFQEPILSNPELLRELGADRAAIAMDQLYRHKNCYVMNNNGARNAALRAGQSRAKWALPWDGNCFVTPSAWQKIVTAIAHRPYLPYFIVPMARILDNAALLIDNFAPRAAEEPQVVFRRDAPDRFNERYRYGRRPKVEFFWQIGVPGEWDAWRNNSWDAPFPNPSPRAGQYATAGWVARLFSGEEHLESADKFSARSRADARTTAIGSFIDALDARLLAARTDPDASLVLDETVLARQARTGDGEIAEIKASLFAQVDDFLARASQPSGLHAEASSVPTRLFLIALAVRLDGRGRLDGQDEARTEERSKGAEVILRTALDGDVSGGLLIEGEVWYLVEAVRLLQGAGILSKDVVELFRTVLAQWLAKASEGDMRVWDATALVDRLVAAHRLGQWRDVLDAMRLLGERHFHGAFPFARTDEGAGATVGGIAAALQRWANAARVCGPLGLDLWNERCVSGRGLEHAFKTVLSTTWADDAPTAPPLRAAAREAYCLPEHPAASAPLRRSHQQLPSGSGVRPYWALG